MMPPAFRTLLYIVGFYQQNNDTVNEGYGNTFHSALSTHVAAVSAGTETLERMEFHVV